MGGAHITQQGGEHRSYWTDHGMDHNLSGLIAGLTGTASGCGIVRTQCIV